MPFSTGFSTGFQQAPGVGRNDQPFFTSNYNTDQFIDPYNGRTIHDDGTPTYTQPDTQLTYFKQRTFNGFCNAYTSYIITLVGPVLVSDIDGSILTDQFGRPLTAYGRTL